MSKSRVWPRRAAVSLLAVSASYAAPHVHPQPLFAYSLRQGVVVLHARQHLPARAAEILRDVEGRLGRSPLYHADRTHDVYICDTPALYAFFTLHHRNTGGETFTWLGNNIFLRPAHVKTDRLIGPSGRDVPGERSLTYFITHEVAHALTADAVGTWRYLRLERWQQDGYADYVAKAGAFDFGGALRGFRADAPDLDPERSGLYLRYHLLVAYLLERRGVRVLDFLSGPQPAAPIEAELRALPESVTEDLTAARAEQLNEPSQPRAEHE